MTKMPPKLSPYHWLPDVPDQRDHLYAKVMRTAKKAGKDIAIPSKADISKYFTEVENQGGIGSCTGNAIVGVMEFLASISQPKRKQLVINLSRLFVYYNERAIEGTVSKDAGAQIRHGIKAVAKIGVCSEKTWPYIEKMFKTKPHALAYAEALNCRALEYHRVKNLKELKHAIASKRPVVFGFTVYENFESSEVAKTGIVLMPKKGEKSLGGHAVVACGYDDKKKLVKCRNSWGAKWGIKGYFYLPYGYFTSRGLSDDFWCITK